MGTSYVSPDAEVGSDCVLGYNVVVESGVSIGHGCHIGHNTVVCGGTIICDEVHIDSNSVIGRQPRSGESSTRPAGQCGPLRIGNRVLVGACAVIYAGSEIADRAMIADLASVREECHVGEAAIIGRAVTVECNTVVGPRSRIQTACYLTGDMIIEEDVFFGPEVCTTNDKYMATRETVIKGPTVRSGAAIGANATLLAGITIGRNAVVGAGSVVTRNVPDGEMYVGVPARRVKH